MGIQILDQPLVSVVITCFNYERFLSKALESALGQTYTNIEIVVVNDGSSDNSDEVIRVYLKNPKVIYIRQENRGQAVAKNVGIRRSNGNYVAFLDADDFWCNEKLQKQMECFKDQKIGVVYCLAKYINENDDIFKYEMTGTYLKPRRGVVTSWLLYDNFVQFSSSIVRKECFDKFGTFDESLKMGIDWDLWLRISTGYEFDYVDEKLFYYRMGHTGQMSRNLSERKNCSDKIRNMFLSTYSDTVSKSDIRKSLAYTYSNGGEYFRKIDKLESYSMFIKALIQNPAWTPAYKGIIKNILNYK